MQSVHPSGIAIRPSAERGRTQLRWLDSRHSFSFNHYYDAAHMGFRTLRVINEDWVSPGGKFGMHPHQDMEIITWVLTGSVVHEDSTGARGVLRPGEAQKMSAGSGIYHSEANGSDTETLHLLQIWIVPDETGLKPYYEQREFDPAARTNRLGLIASPDGRQGSLVIHQDVDLYDTLLDTGASVEHVLRPGRAAWVQVARGTVTLNGHELGQGDAAAFSDESALTLQAVEPAEVLLFDLA